MKISLANFIILISVFCYKNSFSSVRSDQTLQNASSVNDTVVFDLSQVIVTGNAIGFPVSINSADSIFSLDFSFKYNQIKLTYDSIEDMTNYMQSFSFYNMNDSTVRFTSNSIQQYDKSIPIVMVWFTLTSGIIDTLDIITSKGYLNGNNCIIKIIPPSITGINEYDKFAIAVYPNPTSEVLNILAGALYNFQIRDVSGKLIYKSEMINPVSKTIVDVSKYQKGMYILNFTGKYHSFSQKFIVK